MGRLRRMVLARAEKVMASRPPDFEIGQNGDRYMLRWWIIPRNRFFNIYLHQFLHDDDDRALHDHPWASVTWVLRGGYLEHFLDGTSGIRTLGDIVTRGASTAHRVELFKLGSWRLDGTPDHAPGPEIVQATTLFFTGPIIRDWGFHCPKGWVPWQKYVDARDKGAVGNGCE